MPRETCRAKFRISTDRHGNEYNTDRTFILNYGSNAVGLQMAVGVGNDEELFATYLYLGTPALINLHNTIGEYLAKEAHNAQA